MDREIFRILHWEGVFLDLRITGYNLKLYCVFSTENDVVGSADSIDQDD